VTSTFDVLKPSQF